MAVALFSGTGVAKYTVELLRMSRASNPRPAGAGVVEKAMSCTENLVQTRV